MEHQTQSDIISKLWPLGATGVTSLFVGMTLEKFKNRLSTLKYSIYFQQLATSSQTDHWGNIDVYHNNRLTKHLNFVTIQIENSSNIDHQNLNIDISCDGQSQFLNHYAFYNDGNNVILLEKNHYIYYVDVLTRNEQNMQAQTLDPNHISPQQLAGEIKWVQENRKFHLPVFNRRTKLTINLLIENFQGFIPTINVGCLHKSVEIVKATVEDTEIRKALQWTFGIGLVFFIGGLTYLLNYYSANRTPVIVTAILGFSYSIVGLLLFLLGRLIRKMFI